MKKILSLCGTITLIWTSINSLAACSTPQYTKEQLDALKKERNINIKTSKGKDGILEWIAPQEKPFNKVNNKYYFVVWRCNSNSDWKIIKFNNNEEIKRWHPKTLDEQNNIKLCLSNYSQIPVDIDLSIDASRINRWKNNINNYFKSVYCWNGTNEPNTPIIDLKTGEVKI